MTTKLRLLAALFALAAYQIADACPLVCTKTLTEGSEVSSSGTSTLGFNVAVSCPYSWGEDTLRYLNDSLVGDLFDPNVDPQLLPKVTAGATLNYPYSIDLTYEQCKALPGAVTQPDGTVVVTNTATGSTKYMTNPDGTPWVFSCSAQFTCKPPSGGGATRTIGYYKTHAGAVEACLALGAIDLGFTVVDTLDDANGILWASPGSYRNVDKARATLARQVLGATCNARLFGTSDGGLVATAVAALAGRSCSAMGTSNTAVDDFNNSGDDVAFPVGVGPFENTGKPSPIPPFPTSGLTCQ